MYYSHTLNAYDQGDTVVVEYTGFPAPLLRGRPRCRRASATGAPTLDRWMIDLRTGRVRSSRLDDRPQEFPRINESLVSRRHRYAYTASAAEMWRAYGTVDGAPPDEKFSNYLMKHDMPRGRGRSTALPGARRPARRCSSRGAGRGTRTTVTCCRT